MADKTGTVEMVRHDKDVVRGTVTYPRGVLPLFLVSAAATLLWGFHRWQFSAEWVPGQLAAIFGRWHWASSSTNEVYFSLVKIVFCAAPFVVCEIFLGDRKTTKFWRAYFFPISIWFISLSLNCVPIFLAVKFRQAFGLVPFLDHFQLSYAAQAAIWIVAVDFISYVFHRLEHVVPCLWRIHSTHHSIVELNSINQYSHWFESMVRLFIVTIPVSLFVATPALELAFLSSIYAIWSAYTHCNRIEARLPRWATHVLIDNVYHRFHHGREEINHKSNYGNMLTIWDRMFGTWSACANRNFAETGLEHLSPPQSLTKYMAHGFVRKSN